jgi:hypothetical protein
MEGPVLKDGEATFVVRPDDPRQCRWTDSREPPDLQPGQILLAVRKFGLSANNVTYAKFGDDRGFGYWRFFPAAEGWGCIPVWGLGAVWRSRHPDLREGEKVYGFLPMATHLRVLPERVRPGGFADVSPHRLPLPQVYNEYARPDQDPGYDVGREDEHLVLRPLFSLSFFLAEHLRGEGFFGARTVIISSASSKSALGLAFLLARGEARDVDLIGLTSRANAVFVAQHGRYDRVVPYDELDSLPRDAPAVYVDIGGNTQVLADVHARLRHSLSCSLRVGATHWATPASSGPLPGPPPQWFFTPDHIVKRRQEWGASQLRARLAEAWQQYLAYVDDWLEIRRATGFAAIEQAYRAVLNGNVPPECAYVLSFAE